MNTHPENTLHRTDESGFDNLQEGNRSWWTKQTMSYDWTDRVNHPKFSLPWYDEIDRRFIHDSRLFGHERRPFDRLIPFPRIRDKTVLEIGCGMGLHTELMARAGARVTSIDLSPMSVEATQTRLHLKQITGAVMQADAEEMPFEDKSIDFVWSWGVIHHSSRTAKIIREIARVLKPDGECRIMVYNRDGGSAWISMLKYHWLRFGFFRGHSADQSLNRGTDGFHARHYTKDLLEDMFRAFFATVTSIVCGQEVDAVLLPRRLRALVKPMISESWMKKKQSRRGAFLFLTAGNPY